jgi:deazaflavin-dependent oxidoreductase (nitroreductase family)
VSSIEDLASTGYCYLTTTGRTSGRPHRIEIWFVGHAGGAYLSSDGTGSDRYQNLVSNPCVSLQVAGERRETTARPVDAADPENHVVRPAMVAKYQAGYEEPLKDWSERASLVRVEWPAD